MVRTMRGGVKEGPADLGRGILMRRRWNALVFAIELEDEWVSTRGGFETREVLDSVAVFCEFGWYSPS